MNPIYIGVFLLVFTFNFLPQVLSSRINRCNDYLDEFEFCEKQKEKCLRESSESTVCATEHCDCLRKIKPISEICKNAAEGLCTKAMQTHSGKIYTQAEIIEETKWMTGLQEPLEDIKKVCYQTTQFDMETKKLAKQMENFTEFSQKKLPTAIVLHTLMKQQNKSTFCEEGLMSLSKEGEQLDLFTFSKIRVPMRQWYCGWNLGEIGQLVLRIPFIIESPNTVIDFNHCCAIHQSCYYMNSTKKNCDEEFISCTKNVVNRKQSEKSGAMELQKILVEAHLWDSDSAYNNSNLIDYDYATYSKNIDQELHGFSKKKPNYIVTLLEPGREYIEEVRESVREVYKRCKNHKFALSSSVYIYLHCNRFSKLSNDNEYKCFERFKESVSMMNIVDGECNEAIKTFGKIVGPEADGWFLITSFFDSQWLILAEVVLLFISAAQLVCFLHRRFLYCIRCVKLKFYPAHCREEGTELEQLTIRNAQQ
ncbi:unnamed protein product [Caenorhabditis brenneri]